jgi:hypothetical protein
MLHLVVIDQYDRRILIINILMELNLIYVKFDRTLTKI